MPKILSFINNYRKKILKLLFPFNEITSIMENLYKKVQNVMDSISITF